MMEEETGNVVATVINEIKIYDASPSNSNKKIA